MLTTKNIPESKQAKTFGPGNQKAKLNRVELVAGFKPGSYRINLHLEGVDMGADFEGFFIDAESKSGPRYKGQVGRVRLSQYDYEDGVTTSGIQVNRDQSILRGLMNLAKVLGKQDELNKIEVETIEEYVPLASKAMAGDTFINWCIAAKEYEKGGYTNYDLFLPKSGRDQYAYEALDASNSKLLKFDNSKHILAKAVAKTVDSFEATDDTSFTL